MVGLAEAQRRANRDLDEGLICPSFYPIFYSEIGAAGFEPTTSCSQGRRASQAALRPVRRESHTINGIVLTVKAASACRGN